jgi:hypothetical protein
MSKSRLSDLNEHLFAEIERLGDEELEGDKLKEEISRAHAIAGVAAQVVANANLVYRAHMASVEWGPLGDKKLPALLE